MPIGDILLGFAGGLALFAAIIVLCKYTITALDRPAKHQGTTKRREEQ